MKPSRKAREAQSNTRECAEAFCKTPGCLPPVSNLRVSWDLFPSVLKVDPHRIEGMTYNDADARREEVCRHI
jgi:hypothetical protein